MCERLPLTHPQKQIWISQCIYNDNPMFNIGGMITISGSIDIEKLKRSIYLFINRYDAFQIRLTDKDGIHQYFTDSRPEPIAVMDFSTYESPREAAETWGNSEFSLPFTMIQKPLYKFIIYKISDVEYGYFVKCHHIIADGWSMQILTNEIAELYNTMLVEPAQNRNNDYSLFSYKDYVYRQGGICGTSTRIKSFWEEQFKNFDFNDTVINKETRGNRKTFFLSNLICCDLKEFCTQKDVSLNAFFITLYLLLTYKISANRNLCVGIPALGRFGHNESRTFGMFVNVLPFIHYIDCNRSVLEMMMIVSKDLKKYYINQRYPYFDMMKEKRAQNALAYSACVNYYGTKMGEQFGGCPTYNQELYNGHQEYLIQYIIREWLDEETIQVDIDYKISEYTEQDIDIIFGCFNALIHNIISDANQPIHRIGMQSAKEYEEAVVQFNATNKSNKKLTIIDMFSDQSKQTPNDIAVCDADRTITYEQLDCQSNILAKKLKSLGVHTTKLVALYTYHSIETIIGILGVLKAGAAYIPIDPQYPFERIQYILNDSNAAVILHNLKLPEKLQFSGVKIKLSSSKRCLCEYSKTSSISCAYDDPAYIIYTSGSTGYPKGTIVDHYSLCNYISWAKAHYLKKSRAIMPLYSSLSFDFTITSVFLPIVSGGTVVIYNQKEHDNPIYDILNDNKCTIVKLTPAHLALLSTYNIDGRSQIKALIVGGDQLYTDLALSIWKQFEGRIIIYNEYGPTEATVGCMIHQFDAVRDRRAVVPIGKPIQNTQIYILDHNLCPVPIFMQGEIYISGLGLCRGYLNMPERMPKHFIDHPIFGHLYRTGDIGKFILKDSIEYEGRKDRQFKINGYRIEVNEIIRCINRYDNIRDTVVRKVKNRTGQDILIAYFTSFDKTITEKEVKEYIKEKLPYYMIPAIILRMEQFPLTTNGKIDEKALPVPSYNTSDNNDFIEDGRNYSNREMILFDTASDVLGVSYVKPNDHFFRHGGDSIKALLLSSKLKTNGYDIEVKDILFHPTFSDMLNYMKPIHKVNLSNYLCTGEIEQTPIVDWFFSKDMIDKNNYCQSACLQLNTVCSINELEEIFLYLIKYHDALRISIKGDQLLYYNNHCLQQDFIINNYIINTNENLDEKIQSLTDKMMEDISLTESPLIRAALLILPDKSLRLIIVMHHLGIDGYSWRILFEDIDTLIQQKRTGKTLHLPDKTDSYATWASYLYNERQLIETIRDDAYIKEIACFILHRQLFIIQ